MSTNSLLNSIEESLENATQKLLSLTNELKSDLDGSVDHTVTKTKEVIRALESKRSLAQAKLEEFKKNSSDASEDAKIGLLMAYEDLKATVSSIESRFQ